MGGKSNQKYEWLRNGISYVVRMLYSTVTKRHVKFLIMEQNDNLVKCAKMVVEKYPAVRALVPLPNPELMRLIGKLRVIDSCKL